MPTNPEGPERLESPNAEQRSDTVKYPVWSVSLQKSLEHD
jgi:hypothetical protein